MKGKALKDMVDAAGIEPATPAMSRQGIDRATMGNARNPLADMAQCSPAVHAKTAGEVRREPWGTVRAADPFFITDRANETNDGIA